MRMLLSCMLLTQFPEYAGKFLLVTDMLDDFRDRTMVETMSYFTGSFVKPA